MLLFFVDLSALVLCHFSFPIAFHSFITITSVGVGEILSYKGLRQMGLISLQWDLKSETYQGISDKNCIAGFLCLYMVCCFFTRDDLFLFNTICLGLLGMDSNGTLNPGNRLLITWVNMTYQIKDQYLPSIHFSDSGP